MSKVFQSITIAPKVKIVLGLVGMFLLGGATVANVQAAIPDTAGNIKSCYTTGLLPSFRIIDSTASCNVGETLLTWKQGGSATGVLRSDIAGKDLSGSSMVYWDLRAMNLTSTVFGSANLLGADLRESTITGVNFSNANLSWSNLTNLTFQNASLVGADLKGATLTGVNFSNVDLAYANLSDQNLSSRNLSAVTRFEGVTMNGANLSAATLPSAANMKNSIITNTNLNNINFGSANLSGANLTGSTFSNSTLTNVIWVSDGATAICPDGSLASDHSNTCIGHI